MSRIFLDTNLLVYADDNASPMRDSARRIWQELLDSANVPIISTQVLQEYYNTLTKKLRVPPADAQERLKLLNDVELALISREIIYQAIALHQSASVSFWDALIISCAQSAHCTELWTEDMQAGRKFGSLEIINPFLRR